MHPAGQRDGLGCQEFGSGGGVGGGIQLKSGDNLTCGTHVVPHWLRLTLPPPTPIAFSPLRRRYITPHLHDTHPNFGRTLYYAPGSGLRLN